MVIKKTEAQIPMREEGYVKVNGDNTLELSIEKYAGKTEDGTWKYMEKNEIVLSESKYGGKNFFTLKRARD